MDGLARAEVPKPLRLHRGGFTVSFGRAPLGSSRSPARVYRVRSGPARLLKQHAPVRVLRPVSGGRPASQVLRRRTRATSPLRWVLRSPIGRPRSGVQVTSSGSSVPLSPGPPASSNALSPGSTPPLQGTARSVRFIGPAPGRPAITALRCTGFYGPQQTGPAREHGLLARVHRAYSGARPACLSNSPRSGFYAPLQGTARPARSVRFIDPAPGRPGCSRTLPGFIGPAPGAGPR